MFFVSVPKSGAVTRDNHNAEQGDNQRVERSLAVFQRTDDQPLGRDRAQCREHDGCEDREGVRQPKGQQARAEYCGQHHPFALSEIQNAGCAGDDVVAQRQRRVDTPDLQTRDDKKADDL